MIRAGLFLGATAATLALPAAAVAQTESRVSADVSATAGYSNNPFTVADGNGGAAVVTLDVAPRYQLLTPRSTITVSADVNIQQYLSRYGHNDSYSGALDYAGRPSERVTTHARLDLSSAVLGAFNSYLPLAANTGFATTAPVLSGTAVDAGAAGSATAADVVLPVTVVSPLVPYTDVGLFGSRSRRRTGRASGDLGFTLSARDSLSVGGYAEVTRYNNLNGGDYDAFGGSLGYQRRVSGRLSVGLAGSAATYNYHGGFPDNQVYSIQATASGQINERWSANGALGVSFVNGGAGRSTRSTSLSGSINLCRRGPRSIMCVQAARQVAPTGLAGSQYVTTAGLTWNRQLDERQSVSLGGSYSKVGNDTLLANGGLPLQTEYAQATAGYSRRLGSRLSLVASANYRELLGSNVRRSADYGGQIGLSYRFGDRR